MSPRRAGRPWGRLGAVILLLMPATGAAAQGIAPDERRSGITFAGPQTQLLQADDTANPGMLWVLEGAQLWDRVEGSAGRSCESCHGAAPASMRGVAPRYPAFDPVIREAVDLTGRINLCRRRHQDAPALDHESGPMLALSAYVAHQSRGMPLAPANGPRLDAVREEGRRLYMQRFGQLQLSCANCHDDNWRGRLGGSPITQGQSNGYPIYRLEWQGLGSLQRRLRSCMTGVRAEPFAFGAPEHIALEAYLATRGAGLPVEAPGVRP